MHKKKAIQENKSIHIQQRTRLVGHPNKEKYKKSGIHFFEESITAGWTSKLGGNIRVWDSFI